MFQFQKSYCYSDTEGELIPEAVLLQRHFAHAHRREVWHSAKLPRYFLIFATKIRLLPQKSRILN